MCMKRKPKILMLAETHVTDDILNSEINIENYDLIRCNSNSRHTGGVVMYVDNKLKWKVLLNESFSKTWILTIAVDDVDYGGRFTVLYKSPKEKINTFLEFLDKKLEILNDNEHKNIILGDINIDVRKKNKNAKKYIDILSQHNVKQIINEPTRVTDSTQTIIDHLITNIETIQWQINKDSVSDHFMIEIRSINEIMMHEINNKSVNSWKNYSKSKLSEKINAIQWCKSTNLNERVTFMCEKIKSEIDSMVTKRKSRDRKSSWFNEKTFEIKKKINYEKKRADYENGYECHLRIRQLNREYREEIRKAKCNYVQNSIIESQHDQKKMWKILKGLYSDKNNNIKYINVNDKYYDDPIEMAELLNHSIVNSVNEIVSNIPKSNQNDYNEKIREINSTFSIKMIDMSDLLRIINFLKLKSCVSNINGRTIIDLSQNSHFMNELLEIINKSIEEGNVPKYLKISTVTPIPKITNPVKPEDFRPINNLEVIEKVLEAVVHEQLVDYLDENQVLSTNQSGFRKLHSTETSIQTVLYEWLKCRDEKKIIMAVFLDFRRAFETVNRNVLIDKMRKYGFDDMALKWFRSYLSDRKQMTKVNGKMSGVIDVINGLPQGSKLSNLLFILFIDDMSYNVPDVDVNLFADDSLIFVTGKNVLEMNLNLNNALETINDWLKFNSLAINIKKSNAMIIGDNGSTLPDICMNSEKIETVSVVKYLGVFIDDKLNFECHFEKLKAKINKRVGILRRLSCKLTPRTKEIYLKSIILPCYDYCSTVLLMLDNSRLSTLQKSVNKAMRIVLSAPYDTSIQFMLDSIKILSLNNRIKLNCLKFIHRTITRGRPLPLSSKFEMRGSNRQRPLRNDHEYALPNWRLMKSRKSLFYNGVEMYNELLSNYNNELTFHKNAINYIKSMN